MSLEKNNNGMTIFRIAKNNLMSRKMSSFFCMLSILLASALVSALSLSVIGTQTAEKNILGRMQHVMYMGVTEEQFQRMAADDRIERCDPYKELEKEFQAQGVKYRFFYHGAYAESLQGGIALEGREPRRYEEILVDKAFLRALGREAALGEKIALKTGGETEEFTVCGYTEGSGSAAVHAVHVSKAFADRNPYMKDAPYTALVRLNEVTDVPVSTFTTIAYQIAMDYRVERPNVNLNGKFEESLQKGNTGMYAVLSVSVLLFVASSIVIYSIFYLSVTARVQQIGQLQTIGMTEKQVKQMIRREGLLLSVLGIPIGLLIGAAVAYLFIPDGWAFNNFARVALAVSVLGILVVQISVRKPASIASRFSPIEASRNAGSASAASKDRPHGRNNGKHKRLAPYRLALMESQNNCKRWWFTTLSLAFGGIIFMVATTWVASWDEEQYAREGIFADNEYYISYLYSHSTPKPYGITDFQLDGHLGGELEKRIREIPNVTDVYFENEVFGNIEYKGATFLQGFYPVGAEDSEYYQLPAEGNNSYGYMVQHDAILITDCALSETINGITFEAGDRIQFRYFDGEEHTVELEIGAVSQEGVAGYGNRPNFCMADKTVEKLWRAMNTASACFVSVEDYGKHGDRVEAALRALLEDYAELSLSTLRERKIEVSGQMEQTQMQIYGISIFMIVFGIFNLINTVISSIVSRKKELSMLESIGMEGRQVRNMLFWESIFLALPNILLTLTFGTAAGFAFLSWMQKSASYLEYHLPVMAAVFYMAGMIGIPMLVSWGCLKRQNNVSLVERIKNED